MGQALSHLVALGHRRVGYVAGPAASRAGQSIRSILVSAAELTDCEVETITHAPAAYFWLRGWRCHVLAAGVTAVVCHNDLIALGVMARLSERGCSVPGDISVVGCDDIPSASMSAPSLTSVAVVGDDMGRKAVQTVMESVDPASGAPERTKVPANLIVRGSTGVPAEGAAIA